MDTTDKFISVAIAVGVVVLLAMFVWCVYIEVRHPCLRHGASQTCTSFHHVGSVNVPYQYDCTPCIERAP